MSINLIDDLLNDIEQRMDDFNSELYAIRHKAEGLNDLKEASENEIKELKEENKRILTYNNQLISEKHKLKKENENLKEQIAKIKNILNK